MKTIKLLLLFVLGIFNSACAWVSLTNSGNSVRIVDISEISSCKNLGRTSAQVKHAGKPLASIFVIFRPEQNQ